jgi:aerobic carbon-monoxide dehydrogenase small subunit
MMKTIQFTLNGTRTEMSVPIRKHLTDFLREDCELTGSHIGCEHGVCGACSVRLNGVVVRGCLTLAVQVDGQEVETIEGLSNSKEIEDLQQEFIERNAGQCAFCSPGMLVTAAELLNKKRAYSRAEIRDHMSGNFCRCTGYQAIIDAIEAVNNQRLGGAS